MHGNGGIFDHGLGDVVEVALGRFDHPFDDSFDARVAQDLIGIGRGVKLGSTKDGLVHNLAFVIEPERDRRDGQVTIDMEVAGCDAFHKEGDLKKNAGGFSTLVDGQGGVAFFATEQGIERTAKEWMIGREEMNIVPVEGISTVEGGHHAFRVEPGQAVDMAILGLEEVASVAKVFHAEVDIFHQVGHKFLEG